MAGPVKDNEWEDVSDDWEDVKPTGEVPKPISYKEPDTFWGGFTNSIMSGDAIKAGLQGAKGFAKGAVLDLPSSVMGALGSIGNAVSDPGKFASQTGDVLSNLPSDLGHVARAGADVVSRAGSEPENFGRMMGQITGQPLVTAGITEGIPMGTRIPGFGATTRNIPSGLEVARGPVGAAVEGAGRIMRRHTPISGIMPRLAEMRTMRNIERMTGSGLEKVGQRLRNPVKQGQVVAPSIKEGEILGVRPSGTPASRMKPVRPALNESPVTQYGEQPIIPESRRLNSATDIEASRPVGTTAPPAVESGPFEMPGEVIDTSGITIDRPMSTSRMSDSLRTPRAEPPQLDSRITGLPPEEVVPPELDAPQTRQVSDAVNRYAAQNNDFMGSLKREAQRHNMSVTAYIDSIRTGGANDFVMPSASRPRVR